MSARDYITFTSFTPTQNKFRVFLSRVYFSRYVQLAYIFLIVFCVFDLIWAITHYRTFLNDTWTLVMDLILNIIILVDSLLRWYMYGCVNFCNCKENWVEITVAILVVPEVLILLLYLFVTHEPTHFQEIASLAFGGFIIILRPIVFCKRQTKTKGESIYLPKSVIAEENETTPQRIQRTDTPDSDSLMISNHNSL